MISVRVFLVTARI